MDDVASVRNSSSKTSPYNFNFFYNFKMNIIISLADLNLEAIKDQTINLYTTKIYCLMNMQLLQLYHGKKLADAANSKLFYLIFTAIIIAILLFLITNRYRLQFTRYV